MFFFLLFFVVFRLKLRAVKQGRVSVLPLRYEAARVPAVGRRSPFCFSFTHERVLCHSRQTNKRVFYIPAVVTHRCTVGNLKHGGCVKLRTSGRKKTENRSLFGEPA